ncbi:MAG: hypothetical protein JSV49_03380 [Thermoplasmata archaeon]|nr:MAG: hypothetical protein JSV49_03380 [Thermoplasmata archaeon]
MRTTIELRYDIYNKIIKEYGKRKISVTINEILANYFSSTREDMYGADPWLKKVDMSDLRDEHDRDL